MARNHLVQAEKSLNQNKQGYVSKETTEAISREIADTAKIKEIWLHPQKIEQEAQALEALAKKADTESQSIEKLLQQAQMLATNKNTSPTDKKLLADYKNQACSYLIFSDFKNKI